MVKVALIFDIDDDLLDTIIPSATVFATVHIASGSIIITDESSPEEGYQGTNAVLKVLKEVD